MFDKTCRKPRARLNGLRAKRKVFVRESSTFFPVRGSSIFFRGLCPWPHTCFHGRGSNKCFRGRGPWQQLSYYSVIMVRFRRRQSLSHFGGDKLCHILVATKFATFWWQQSLSHFGGDKVCHILGGDKVCPILDGDKICHIFGGDKVCHIFGGDKICHIFGGE